MEPCLFSVGALTCYQNAGTAARSAHSAIMNRRRKRLDVDAMCMARNHRYGVKDYSTEKTEKIVQPTGPLPDRAIVAINQYAGVCGSF